jgi:hypothetical protein
MSSRLDQETSDQFSQQRNAGALRLDFWTCICTSRNSEWSATLSGKENKTTAASV